MKNKGALTLTILLSGHEKVNFCRAYFILKLSKNSAGARTLEISAKYSTNGQRDVSCTNAKYGKPEENKRTDKRESC